MPYLDLHGDPLVYALSRVVRLYNSEARPERRGVIRVNHGYGSSGKGGVIRYALRAYLIAHGVKYETGEYAERNPGITIVFIGREGIVNDYLSRWEGGRSSQEENVRLFSYLQQRFERMKEKQDEERNRLSNLLEEAQRHQGELTARLANREAELKRNTAISEELDDKQAKLTRERERVQVAQNELETLRRASVTAGEHALNEGRQQASEELARRKEELTQKGQDLDAQREEQLLFRKQLLVLREEVSVEKDRVEHDLRLRTEQLNQFAVGVSKIEEENARLRKELGDSEKRIRRGLWHRRLLGVLAFVLLFCFVSAIVVYFVSSRGTPNRFADKPAEKPAPPSNPGSGLPNVKEPPRPPTVRAPKDVPADRAIPAASALVPPSVVPTRVFPADVPIKTPERPRVEAPVEKSPVGPPATERQIAYVAGLVRRKGWSEKERDAEINKVLGYVRSYQNLTKREASSLIDAWK
jgi:hypothetical protein